MDPRYHRQMTVEELKPHLSPRALQAVVQGNLGQDSLLGQIAHPEYHFDEDIQAGSAYVESQRDVVLQNLSQEGRPEAAWAAFGRLTHAVQDFYAHTNYIALWLSRYPSDGNNPPRDVAPLDPEILRSPNLRSGKIYPLEALGLIPPLRPLARRLLPPDSHAHMNLDDPTRGPLFPYALTAARRHTRYELHHTLKQAEKLVGDGARARFCDLT
jgi:hypothetical protein